MTIKDIVNQLMDLSVDRCIDGNRTTKKALAEKVRTEVQPGSPLLCRITLPDGAWRVKIERWGQGPDGYDYWVPDTRTQENLVVHGGK